MGKAKKAAKTAAAKGPTKGSTAASKAASSPRAAAVSFPHITAKPFLKTQWLAGQHLFTAGGVLSEDECTKFVAAAEALGMKHQGSRGAAHGEAYRDNDRASVNDPALASQLWERTGLGDLMDGVTHLDGHRAVGLNPNIRFYRYSPGQRFGRHIDESVECETGTTAFTLLVYLSGLPAARGGKRGRSDEAGLRGGETIFYGDRGEAIARVAPQTGMALLHRHGEDDCLEHEGAEVTQGIKWVMRSDVIYAQA